jgi:hypothetical protein
MSGCSSTGSPGADGRLLVGGPTGDGRHVRGSLQGGSKRSSRPGIAGKVADPLAAAGPLRARLVRSTSCTRTGYGPGWCRRWPVDVPSWSPGTNMVLTPAGTAAPHTGDRGRRPFARAATVTLCRVGRTWRRALVSWAAGTCDTHRLPRRYPRSTALSARSAPHSDSGCPDRPAALVRLEVGRLATAQKELRKR